MQYHIAKNGQQAGIFSEAEVRAKLQSGAFAPADLCWTEGMADWQPISSRFDLSAPAAAAGTSLVSSGFDSPANPYAPPQAEIMPRQHGEPQELATLGQRLGAALLDGLIWFVAVLPAIVAVVMSEAANAEQAAPFEEMSPLSMGLAGVTGLLVIVLIIINLYMLAVRGQTLAKKWLGIRIVTYPDGQNPGGVKTILLRGFVNGIIANIPFLGAVYAIVDILFIFGEERRCIHDLIAGTKVVKGQPPV